ncbi:MAG: hypothetical protein M1366_05590 [Patescibacteria group bacterium]|nr:hypothetical protein [Patescibacteria group bacterium]
MEKITSFEDLLNKLKSHYNLEFLGENKDEACNKLYAFRDTSTSKQKTHILKTVTKDHTEVQFYIHYLPRIKSQFKLLRLPELIGLYEDSNSAYLLLPYYEGDKFNFSTNDLDLASGMAGLVEDLTSIEVESVIEGGSAFDHHGYEQEFWDHFDKVVSFNKEYQVEMIKGLNLIEASEETDFRQQAEAIPVKGRSSQKMIISNGDFNPRNVIRMADGKLVLIDWNGIVAPLEHHLTYPWLLNWQNPAWQKKYAEEFEKRLPVNADNLRYHLMRISIIRTAGEMGHYKPRLNENPLFMVKDHMKNFRHGLKGFKSLLGLFD